MSKAVYHVFTLPWPSWPVARGAAVQASVLRPGGGVVCREKVLEKGLLHSQGSQPASPGVPHSELSGSL